MNKRKTYTEDDYKIKCKELNVIFVGTHKESHRGTMIDYICSEHKDKGVQSCDWAHFRLYKKSCPYCSGRYKTNADILPTIKNKNVELISEYTGNEKPITCRCKECGNVWTTLPKVLVTNGSGCPVCGKLKAVKAESKSHDEFVAELKKINPHIEVLGEYKNTHHKIKCRCKIDNTIWYGYPANLLNRSAGCPTCSMSYSEREMLDVLKKLGFNIVSQHTIDGCEYKSKLKFDAFDIDRNIAFEYNGEQHYRPVDFAGKGEKWAKKQLQLTQNREKAKIEFCSKNKIPIIIVPYWERNNMESFIISELKKIGEIKV